jgi:L,D-transpeptidase YbiS
MARPLPLVPVLGGLLLLTVHGATRVPGLPVEAARPEPGAPAAEARYGARLAAWGTRLPATFRRSRRILVVDPDIQTLGVLVDGGLAASFRVSTGRGGLGHVLGGAMTPLGWHRIRAKVGRGLAAGAVLVHQQATGRVWSPGEPVLEDGILSRILVLEGLEAGLNRGGAFDTLAHGDFIHGTSDTEGLGRPVSHGCIRLHFEEVIALCDLVAPGDLVLIAGGTPPPLPSGAPGPPGAVAAAGVRPGCGSAPRPGGPGRPPATWWRRCRG